MSFTNEIWLTIRTGVADQSGAGTPSDPYAANTPESFGNIMRVNVPSNRSIRLGPGIFHTRGGGGNGILDASVPDRLWRVRPGQRITGAGIFATTLRFLWDAWNIAPRGNPAQRHNMILGEQTGDPLQDFLSSFELSDLTLDLGLDKTPFDPDPKTIEATQGLTVTVSGDTVMASSAFFTSAMAGKNIYVYNPANQNFAFYASIKQVAAGGPHTTATLDRTATIMQVSVLTIDTYG